MSSITVSGITPSLSILGAFQEFIYNQNSSAFRLSNTFVPIIGVDSVTNSEFRNNALSGFRWTHTTNTTDTIGQLKLQSFLGASPTGTDIISFNNDGSLIIYSPITIPTIINVNGSGQMFRYDTPTANFEINNIHTDSSANYSIYTDIGYRTSYGYDFLKNESYIDSDGSLALYANSTTPQIYIDGGTGYISINNKINSNIDLNSNSIINAVWNGSTIDVSKGGTGQTTLTSNALLTGNGTSAISQITPGYTGTVLIGNTGGAPSFSSTPSVSSITISNDPVSSTDGVNKAYVDAIAAGIEYKQACYGATTANLTATYNNGVNAGVGATLTSTFFGTFTIDGLTPSTSKRILVKNQTSSFQNGVYTVFNVGGPAAQWVLKRATDFDQPSEINAGILVPVEFGTVNAVSSWIQTSNVNSVGIDNITFTPFTYSPGSYLQVSNNLSDVASAATSRTNLGLTNVATQNVTTNAVLLGAASNTINSVNLTNGQILIGSTGSTPVGAVPTNGTNISWSTGAGSLTANISGQVGLDNGGTNANLTASNGGIVYSTDTSLNVLPGTDTAKRLLMSGANNTPLWSTATYPAITITKQLLYSVSGNNVTGLSTLNNGVLITSSAGYPSWTTTLSVDRGGTGLNSTTAYGVICGGITTTDAFQNAGTGTSGQVLTSNGSSALPTWQTVTGSCGGYYMQGNATGASATTFIKATGTTIAGSNLVNFTHTNGRLTYTGSDTIKVLAIGSVWMLFSSGPTINCCFAKNNTVINESTISVSPVNSNAIHLNLPFNVIVTLTTNDYLEVYMKSSTSSNITPVDLIVTVAQI